MGNRIYYAIEQIGISSGNSNNFVAVHGCQNITTNATLNLSPISTLGNIVPELVIEDNTSLQLTANKIFDGYPLIFHLAGNNRSGIFDACNQTCSVALSIFDDTNISATGTPTNILKCENMQISSFRYMFDVNNNFSEEIGFIGDKRVWKNDAKIINPNIQTEVSLLSFTGVFNNKDTPLHRISRRWDFAIDSCVLPKDMLGVDNNGKCTGCHINSINISADINRTNIPSLGKKDIYQRPINAPTEITTEININPVSVSNSGDIISFSPSGILSDGTVCHNYGNISGQVLQIAICDNILFNLGSGNRLAAISYQGGSAGNGYRNVIYTYKTYDIENSTITHN